MSLGLGLPSPARVRGLATGLGPVSVLRQDLHTLVVTPGGGYLNNYDSVFRGPAHPLGEAQVVDLGDMQATILALTPDGRPATVAFHFAASLEDPRLAWFCWRDGLYAPFTPPPVGATIQIPSLASPNR